MSTSWFVDSRAFQYRGST